ncbi:hypothetical protein CK203_096820 [Vitis vinifera]|uniref:Uncharacterized protein n=1 Tax=Vitis vinifera TaxID=29760 RepID=A0A438EJP4_VITVI|nr:hypothetical protein CK203_096820 [Vitis vinifera]
MAAAAVVMMIATSLLLIGIGSVNVGEAWEEANVIHVGGKVLCQDCTKGWNEWVNGSNPIKGSRVSVTCMDDRRRVMYYGSDETDEAGKYELIVDKYVNGKEVKATGCWVRLVSSSDPTCNIPTDFAGGRSG